MQQNIASNTPFFPEVFAIAKSPDTQAKRVLQSC